MLETLPALKGNRKANSAIAGFGLAVPEHHATQEAALEHAKQRTCSTERQQKVLEQLYRRTGIKTRHHCGQIYPLGSSPTTGQRMQVYAERAPALAEIAAKIALDDAQIDPTEITHVISVSCTGFMAPALDVQLVKRLALNAHVGRMNLGFMGCHGAFNGFRAAQAIMAENESNVVLLSCTELCSLHFQYGWDSDSIVANSLFADGSAAVIVRSPMSAGSANARQIRDFISCIVPETEDAMTWRIGDTGFVMTLDVSVPAVLRAQLRPWLLQWLNTHGLGIEDVPLWAVHPGGPRILDAVSDALDLNVEMMEHSLSIYERFGNMSSPTVLFILAAMSDWAGPCVALGFGPGLSMEAILFD
jgi:predicted naringenin-chalcone synthase